MEKLKRAFLIDVKNKTSRELTINDSLDEFYKVLDCTTIDITSREIGGNYYEIVCDDEGLFAENPIVSAIDSKYKPTLVGNLLIFGVGDENGELQSLTDEDVDTIKKSIVKGVTEFGILDVLVCDY